MKRPPKKLPDALVFKNEGRAPSGPTPPPPREGAPKPERNDKARRRSVSQSVSRTVSEGMSACDAKEREPHAKPALKVVPRPEESETANPLPKLSDERLVKRYKNARAALRFHDKGSEAAAEVRKSLAELVAEFDRRGLEVPGRKARL
jgi:hypothetical protein